jgi:hypothetical protein
MGAICFSFLCFLMKLGVFGQGGDGGFTLQTSCNLTTDVDKTVFSFLQHRRQFNSLWCWTQLEKEVSKVYPNQAWKQTIIMKQTTNNTK